MVNTINLTSKDKEKVRVAIVLLNAINDFLNICPKHDPLFGDKDNDYVHPNFEQIEELREQLCTLKTALEEVYEEATYLDGMQY